MRALVSPIELMLFGTMFALILLLQACWALYLFWHVERSYGRRAGTVASAIYSATALMAMANALHPLVPTAVFLAILFISRIGGDRFRRLGKSILGGLTDVTQAALRRETRAARFSAIIRA